MTRETVDGFLDRLAEGGVGVDVAGDLMDGEVPLLGQRQFGEQLGDVRAEEVSAYELAVLGVTDELHEAGRITQARSPGDRGERELRHLDVETLLPRLVLGVAEAGDLRLAEVVRGIMT
ncbi:hypothetical protein TUSST3_54560 [Streptomyces sp. TUS-ST3]|nr:hypothetical protein TUSST3_54560 [Streptomyces sp. TUS-ST3]